MQFYIECALTYKHNQLVQYSAVNVLVNIIEFINGHISINLIGLESNWNIDYLIKLSHQGEGALYVNIATDTVCIGKRWCDKTTMHY